MNEKNNKRTIFGWSMYDWAKSAYETTTLGAVLPVYFVSVVVPEEGFEFRGNIYTGAEVWGFAIGSALFIFFLIMPTIGAIGDMSGNRMKFFKIFAYGGAVFASSFYFATSGDVILTLGIYFLAQFGATGSNVFYDSVLKDITTEEIISILGSMGLKYVEGPDIEDDFHNFTALNIPLDHPARQMHDTFYIKTNKSNKNVLRTHTSPVQIRSLKNQKVPIKIFAPGRTYRCDSDITHTPMFHQVEGLVVDKDISFSNLKWFVSEFCKTFFNNESLKLRFRPSFFPFTEPSAEVDVNCSRKKGKLILGEGDEWMEILGCGMVHPNVFELSGFSTEGATGFAFGIGIERLAMLKYGMPDLRNFFENDIRWLNHYGFSCFDIPDLNWD